MSDESRRKKILIVSPPYRLAASSIPLGPMYVAAVLQNAGHHVEVIDMDVKNLTPAHYLRELRTRDYDYFCIGGLITAWNFIRYSVEAVKHLKPAAKVIVGGGIITSTPRSLISLTPVDVGIVGEAEDSILEIIEAFEGEMSFDDVLGIVYKREGVVFQTKQRPPIDDLDKIPFPAWDLFDFQNTYALAPTPHSLLEAKRGADVCTTRGCPYQCTFCFTRKQIRQRSVFNIIEEIQILKDKYGVGYVSLADDLFVVNRQRAEEFCHALIKNKIKIGWSAAGRANLLDRDFLKLCKEAGCKVMGFGIESGSPSLLKRMRKNQTPEQIVESIKIIEEAGITSSASFILGLPGENRETIRETVDLCKKLNEYRTYANAFFFATPYPGTEMYRQLMEEKRISEETKFFEAMSEKGDATNFLINCTHELTDAELVQLKGDIEAEILSDLIKRHPFHGFVQWITERGVWGKIRNLLLEFKMKGLRRGCEFLFKKICVRTKKTRDPFQRIWNKKRDFLNDIREAA